MHPDQSDSRGQLPNVIHMDKLVFAIRNIRQNYLVYRKLATSTCLSFPENYKSTLQDSTILLYIV